MHLLLEDINPFHQHIDFIYYAQASSAEFFVQEGESTDLHWFSAEALENLDKLPDNVKISCLEAIKLFAN